VVLVTGFIAIGVLFLMAGLAALVVALRGDRNRPRTVAMLIGGMMATALGLLLAGFAIAYRAAPPLDLNTAEPAR
jgi:hypothetical protein